MWTALTAAWMAPYWEQIINLAIPDPTWLANGPYIFSLRHTSKGWIWTRSRIKCFLWAHNTVGSNTCSVSSLDIPSILIWNLEMHDHSSPRGPGLVSISRSRSQMVSRATGSTLHRACMRWYLTMAEGVRFLYEPGKFQVTNEMKQQFEKDGYIIVRWALHHVRWSAYSYSVLTFVDEAAAIWLLPRIVDPDWTVVPFPLLPWSVAFWRGMMIMSVLVSHDGFEWNLGIIHLHEQQA